MIVLALQMKGEWLERAFQAGANGAMSKALHPVALSTLLRAAVSGHIVHSPASIRSVNRARGAGGHGAFFADTTGTTDPQLVASGATNADIARQLWITQQTVKFHVSNVYRKLDVGNRTEACHYAHVNGLVDPRQGRPPNRGGRRSAGHRVVAIGSEGERKRFPRRPSSGRRYAAGQRRCQRSWSSCLIEAKGARLPPPRAHRSSTEGWEPTFEDRFGGGETIFESSAIEAVHPAVRTN